jgi:hypothetical protein
MEQKYSTTFENAMVGDKVYSPTFGWGEIREISEDSQNVYYIHVYFDNHGFEQYTLDGYFHSTPHTQSLFWDEVFIKAPAKPVKVAATKIVNGVEIPNISYHPKTHHHCNIPAPANPAFYENVRCYNNENIAYMSALGLCYPNTEKGKAAAILHAKAMLGIAVQENQKWVAMQSKRQHQIQ